MRFENHWGSIPTLMMLLGVPALAQNSQLNFHDARHAIVQPTGFFAQISDDGSSTGVTEQISDSLTPVPELDGSAFRQPGAPPTAPTVAGSRSKEATPSAASLYTLNELETDSSPRMAVPMGCDSAPYGNGCPLDCGGSCMLCCGPGTQVRGVYAGYLALRPRDAEVSYAVPIDGPITSPPANNPIQIASYGVLDPDFESGFFVGLRLASDATSSLDARLTMFDSSTSGSISTTAPNVLRSLVAHPSSGSAASDFLSADADLDIEFDLVDLTYRSLLNCGAMTTFNTVVGARYANLDQRFQSVFVNNGTETVNTDIDFDGGGFRVGFEAARYQCQNQLYVYANSAASFLAGEFRGNYFQGQSFDPTVVDTHWDAGRVVPILDLELGLGWASRSGRFRLSGGYLFSAWYNVVKTEEWIAAVQNNDLTELSDTLTFDGLRIAAELRY